MRDVIGRVGQYARPEIVNLGTRRRGADKHAVAACAVDFLDHQVRHVVDDMVELFGLAAHEGRHVGDFRLFVEVKADHVRHVRVDRLVVRHARSDGIADRHGACAQRAHEALGAERRILAKDFRIQKVVVDAPVDDIDAARPLRRAHIDHVVLDEEILALDELHAHLLR